jgi:hypothetical protein
LPSVPVPVTSQFDGSTSGKESALHVVTRYGVFPSSDSLCGEPA